MPTNLPNLDEEEVKRRQLANFLAAEQINARLGSSTIPQAAQAARQRQYTTAHSMENEVDRQFKAQEYQKKRENDLRMAQQYAGALGDKMPSSVQGETLEAAGFLDQLADFNKNYGGTEWVNRGKDFGPAALRAIGLDYFANLMEEESYAGKALEARQRVLPLVAQMRHALAGAGLTQYEGSEFLKISPMAQGISQQEADRRLMAMAEDYKRTFETNLRAYGKDPQTTLQEFGTQMPPDPSAPVEQADQPTVQARRSLGGKNYVKINGQWYEE